MKEAMQPLEAHVADPLGGTFLVARKEVKSPTDANGDRNTEA